MKYVFINLFLILAIVPFSNSSGQTAKDSIIGIVAADQLNCRTNPSINSKVVHKYFFGDILTISNQKKIKDIISQKSGYWSKISGSKCWIFDAYVIKSEKKDIFRLNPEEYHCIGTEGYKTYPIFLVNTNYIAFYERFIGPAPSPTRIFIEIGNLSKTQSKIIFQPSKTIAITPLSKVKVGNIPNRKRWLIVSYTDNSGPYYGPEKPLYLRADAKLACKDKTKIVREAPWIVYFTIKDSSLNDIQEYIKSFRLSNAWDQKEYDDWVKQNCIPNQNFTNKCDLDN